jgi:hypothetical protein
MNNGEPSNAVTAPTGNSTVPSRDSKSANVNTHAPPIAEQGKIQR